MSSLTTATPEAPSSGVFVIKDSWVPIELSAKLRDFNPRSELGLYVRECLSYLPSYMAAELIERVSRSVVIESALRLVVYRQTEWRTEHCDHVYTASWGYALCSRCAERFELEDYGIVGRKVVTTAGMNFVVDAFQNSVEVENLKYHALGTGSTAEAAGDTTLVTELTTEYTGNVRATGTTTEGASANIYRTVATNTLDGTPGAALREHGVFSADAAGTLLDRTVFSAITLSSGDGLQSTYEITFTAGG